MSLKSLLNNGPKIINIGMERFYSDLREQKVETVLVDWKPPLAGKELLGKLRKMRGDNVG